MHAGSPACGSEVNRPENGSVRPVAANWRTPESSARTQSERRAWWEAEHRDHDYGNVFSITEDEKLLAEVIEAAGPDRDAELIVVPGCGSRTNFERALVVAYPSAQIHAIDFPDVVKIAAERFEHPRVHYSGGDIAELELDGVADAVFHLHSVVSDSDEENRAILASSARALRPGGVLVGLFGSPYEVAEMGVLTGDEELITAVDLQTGLVQGLDDTYQLFYGPIRLRHILREAGLELSRFALRFHDTEVFRAQDSQRYDRSEPDLVMYGHLVTAHRPVAAD
jgi:SAM-dependent methyltransferase